MSSTVQAPFSVQPAGRTPSLAESLGEIRHFAVLGFPRSGTTLVMNVLGEHPEVSMLDEEFHGAIFRLTGSKARGVKLCVPTQIQMDRVWHPLYRLAYLNGILRKSTLRRLRPMSRYSIRHLAELSRMSFVCVLRDPAANLDALERRVRLNTYVRRVMWRRFIEIMGAMDAEPDWDVVFVSFEKLVRDPEPQIRALCERIGLDYHERMLDAPRFTSRYRGQEFNAERANGGDYPSAEELGLGEDWLKTYERLLAKAI
jgi:hypothetical protein